MKIHTLLERSMSAKTLTAGISQSNAIVGFEFEILVPHGTRYFTSNNYKVPDTVDIDTDDYYTLVEWFTLARSDFRDLEKEYERWAAEKIQDQIEKEWKTYDGELSFDEFVEQQEGEIEKPDETAWINDIYGTVRNLVLQKHLEPVYGWADETKMEVFRSSIAYDMSKIFDETAAKVGRDLAEELGISEFKIGHGGLTDWKIVEDNSIASEHGLGVGLEIVTAPLPAQQAVEVMHKCFSFFRQSRFITNSSTGAHVNISMQGLDNLDPLKLVLFMGEMYALSQFKRHMNSTTAPQLRNLVKAIGTGASLRPFTAIMDEARIILNNSGKYRSVNISKLHHGYLEFRVAGGQDYHKQEELLTEQLGRWLEALKIAIDPDLYRNEYLKKVVKLMSMSGVPIEDPLALKAKAKLKKA